MATIASGGIAVWAGASLWTFDVPYDPPGRGQTDQHSHHALQLTLAVDGAFRLHLPASKMDGPAVLVAPDVPHAFEPRGTVALLFIEPESPAGRGLLSSLLKGEPAADVEPSRWRDLAPSLAEAHRSRDRRRLEILGRQLVERLAAGAAERPLDRRVARMIDWTGDRMDSPLGIAEAANAIGLSPSRASHLFVQETGLAFRTYVLWLRLMRAVETYADGGALTEAAHEAGFADSAHLSRTFHRMFGVPANALLLT